MAYGFFDDDFAFELAIPCAEDDTATASQEFIA